MNTVRPCGCKGCRTCLLCEKEFNILDKPSYCKLFQELESFVFCPECNKVYPGWDVELVCSAHPDHLNSSDEAAEGIDFPGILVMPNFLTAKEGTDVMRNLDEITWQPSQSGRRKQNFGPKTNFKKKKLHNGDFNGFPAFSRFIQERFEGVPLLSGFQTIEQCTLEYSADKGASIDPHIDDCWVWGERIVTVNCLGDSVLTLSPYSNVDRKKYNCDLVDEYKDTLITELASNETLERFSRSVIRIPMPNLSLIVLYGPPRYQFEHAVLREDIEERRVCIAYREFTPNYLKGGCDEAKGEEVLRKAQNFWDHKNLQMTAVEAV